MLRDIAHGVGAGIFLLLVSYLMARAFYPRHSAPGPGFDASEPAADRPEDRARTTHF